ncbi:MAG: hypothetical protein FWG10_04695 [Eubacteriaceae bacterium]|nr:hypothetical protein [Eubacteriaceae bacterium]
MDKMQERIKLIQDTVAFKKTSRIPTFSNYWTYMIFDAGHKLGEALYDYDLLYDIIIKFHLKYEFDSYIYKGARNPMRVSDAVEGNRYLIDDEMGSLSYVDYPLMQEDEYPQLIEDPRKFYWSVLLPRKNKALREPGAFDAFAKSFAELEVYNAFVARVDKTYTEEFEIPQRNAAMVPIPLETLFNYIRGIKATAIDIRRRPEQVDAACEAIAKYANVQAAYERLAQPIPPNYIFGGHVGMLSHSILNPKQFGKFFWPTIKNVYDECEKQGKPMMLFSEAQCTTFTDYFQDFKKGVVVIQPEQDDVFELRRRLPGVAIAGGLKSSILGVYSAQACVDYAKKLVNEVGADGGLIMNTDKMMSYANDAKSENILAVQEFCRSYTG